MISYCRAPYPNHPNGCPNWGIKKGCPPNVPCFLKEFNQKVLVCAVGIDFAHYLQIRRDIHPNWTERALRNPRHWQGHLRMLLRKDLLALKDEERNNKNKIVITNPEAMGINIFETCKQVGLILERTPLEKMYQVAFLATKKP